MCKGDKKCKKCAINMATKRKRYSRVRGVSGSKATRVLGMTLSIAGGRIVGDTVSKVLLKSQGDWTKIGVEGVFGAGTAMLSDNMYLELAGASAAANATQKAVAKITPSMNGIQGLPPYRQNAIGNGNRGGGVPQTEFKVY
jgi:hypothetical protein